MYIQFLGDTLNIKRSWLFPVVVRFNLREYICTGDSQRVVLVFLCLSSFDGCEWEPARMDTMPTIIVLIKREFDTFHWGGLRLCTLDKDAFPESGSAWCIRSCTSWQGASMPGRCHIVQRGLLQVAGMASRHSLVTQVGQCSDQRLAWTTHVWLFRLEIGSQIAALPPLFLCSLCPFLGVWSHTQPLPANAVQVDKTVAEP